MRPSEVLKELNDKINTLEKEQAIFISEQKAFNEALMEKVDRIGVQTTLTNGRVSTLEKWRAKLSGVWMAVLIAGSITVFVSGIILWTLEQIMK